MKGKSLGPRVCGRGGAGREMEPERMLWVGERERSPQEPDKEWPEEIGARKLKLKANEAMRLLHGEDSGGAWRTVARQDGDSGPHWVW